MDRRDFVAASAGLAFVGGVSGVHASAPVKLTPVMEQAREAGLKSLKPTALELEHGLRLHAESVYGFAPRAALDVDALRQAYDEGASDAEIQDIREEMGRFAAEPGE